MRVHPTVWNVIYPIEIRGVRQADRIGVASKPTSEIRILTDLNLRIPCNLSQLLSNSTDFGVGSISS